jgi:hypothetical protein
MKQILYIIGFILLATVITASNYYSFAPVAPSGTIGDLKSGAQPTDHNGWIKLDGRLKSTLTPNQQANATFFGVGANLPVGNGRAFIQGTILAQIGSTTITQANLPAVNLVGGSHAHAITDPGHSHNIVGNANGATGGSQGTFTTVTGTQWSAITSNGTGISIQSSGNLSIPLGGSGTAYTPAGIGCNQFIYLGN